MCFPLASITKKQIVAVTGLMLIIFIIGHLAGNLLIYGGPELFNKYAETLDHLRPLTTMIEYALLAVFLVHIFFTASVVHENIKARGGLKRYAVEQPVGDRSIATKLMPYTGLYIFIFIIWHLFDFMFANDEGPRSVIAGKSLGIYGVVINAFKDPVHGLLYIIAICCLGLHLAHGVESVAQSWGLNHPKYTPIFVKFSRIFALLIVLGFSSLPIYVFFYLR